MLIQNIELINFKNYKEVSVSFSPKLNFITGANGSGKTNLLDAIYYLSSGRSALNSIDGQNINHEESFFLIKGMFEKEDKKYVVSCQMQKGQKKTLWVNKKKVEKMSGFIGSFPVVLITPDDNEIIKEGSEIRRSFFDNIFSQMDKNYLNALIEYTKALKLRNLLLKQFAENHFFDKDLLEPYNHILEKNGSQIHQLRIHYLEKFMIGFNQYYQLLTGVNEVITLKYQSSLFDENLYVQLEKCLGEDRALQRTCRGIHKDDFLFLIGGQALKKFGSQGQQKSFLIALKMGHHSIIKQISGINPPLLLDDIFDKLDESRIAHLLHLVLREEFGQVFITDARPSVSLHAFKENIPLKKILKVANNQIEEG